jgi:cobalamin biosynthesis protein CobT
MRRLLSDVFKLDPEDIPPPDMADCAEWADEKYGIDPDCAMAGATAPGHFTIKFDDIIDDHDARRDPDRRSSSTIDYSNYSDNVDANPHTIDTTCIISEPVEDIHQWFVERTHEAIAKSNIKTLRKKATRYLHAAVQTHYRTNQKKGRFDSRKVFKLADRDIKEPLIYKTTEQNEHVNTAVSILVDASASMHGEKQYMATVAAIGMSELCRASRAAFEVAFFSDIGRNHHFLAKQFNQSYNEDRLVRMADTAYDAGCVNADADSILIAYHRLEARTESRKILIVMSDGCPSSTNGGGNPLRYAQNVVRRIETRTNVDIIGVGIDDQSVERIYQNNRVCRSIEYLPDVLLGILKHTLTIKQRTRQ